PPAVQRSAPSIMRLELTVGSARERSVRPQLNPQPRSTDKEMYCYRSLLLEIFFLNSMENCHEPIYFSYKSLWFGSSANHIVSAGCQPIDTYC
ncbi:hypothetical protein ACFL6P_08180, partial [Candidatus Latescibacterota bacterium]